MLTELPDSLPAYRRPLLARVVERLAEPRRFIQVLAGPRQAGKTTLALQALAAVDRPHHYASADSPSLQDRTWVEQAWRRARMIAEDGTGAVLVLDEVQKIERWADVVKARWDEDTRSGRSLHVVLLGSSPLLVHRGLTESLAGRFEVLRVPHWSYREMSQAFGWTLDEYLFFGGYPGAAPLTADEDRWRSYILESLVETTVGRDILLHAQVRKPALLRRLFDLACRYSGQILSYQKMLGQLQDAGNTTTLAHYLGLLEGAGMVAGIEKYAGEQVRRRASSPKLQVLNTALMSAVSGRSFSDAMADSEYRGRLVESAVGAHLLARARLGGPTVYYWRDRGREVDFVVETGEGLAAIEVKSGRRPAARPGLDAFERAFGPAVRLRVGTGGLPVEEFLSEDPLRWIRG